MTIQSNATTAHLPLRLRDNVLRPYVSALILEDRLAGTDAPPVTPDLLLSPLRRGTYGKWRLVAEGVSSLDNPRSAGPEHMWDIAIYQSDGRPSWAIADLSINDLVHHLVMVRTYGRLVAVHASATLRDALLSAMKSGRLDRLRRVDPDVLEGALIAGDTTSLYLQGAHRPRRTKADTKAIRGQAAQEVLSPTEDGTFYVTAAQVGPVPGIPDTMRLGVSPPKSSVWLGQVSTFKEFDALLSVVVGKIGRALAGPTPPAAYGILARPRGSLESVRNPFELVALAPERLPPNAPEALTKAAETLAGVEFEVEPACNGVDFQVRAVQHGRHLFRAVGRFAQDGWETRLRFIESSEVDPEAGRQALRALAHVNLLSVHFLSGETWQDGRVFDGRIPDVSFPNWRWGDFTGVTVTREKPGVGSAFDRRAVGGPGDDSLFGWVVRTFGPDRYLNCDDGAGEIADFIAVDGGESVQLIHVKAAGRARGRRVAVQPYEAATAQAEKNTRHARLGDVREALATRPAGPTWECGIRDDASRADLLAFLAACDQGRPVDVVIVQPHVTRSAYLAARGASGSERARLRLLDWHLNATRRVVTAAAGDLVVYGDAS